jgi:hypothetical protein
MEQIKLFVHFAEYALCALRNIPERSTELKEIRRASIAPLERVWYDTAKKRKSEQRAHGLPRKSDLLDSHAG